MSEPVYIGRSTGRAAPITGYAKGVAFGRDLTPDELREVERAVEADMNGAEGRIEEIAARLGGQVVWNGRPRKGGEA